MTTPFEEFRSLIPREYDIERLGDAESEAFFDKAADHILAATKAPLKSKARGPKPKKVPQKPRPPSIKRAIRRALQLWVDTGPDSLNAVVNVIYKQIVRPRLAEVWTEGFEAGVDHLSQCCGCSGLGDPPPNPYGSREGS